MELKAAMCLVLCEESMRENIELALGPVVKSVTFVKNSDEAHQRCTRQGFQFFVLRLPKSQIGNKDSFYAWSRQQKNFARTPWLVLGQDIEIQAKGKKDVHVIEDADDALSLLQKLKELFPPDRPEERKVSSASSTAAFTPETPFPVGEIRPVLTSLVSSLKTVLGKELTKGDSSLSRDAEAPALENMVGSFVMATDRLEGSLGVYLSRELKSALLKGQKNPESVEADFLRRWGDLMRAHAKRDLEAEGHRGLNLELDMKHDRHEAYLRDGAFYLRFPLTAPEGPLTVECLMKSRASEP